MAGRRRGRTGRGWDAAPPRARRSPAREPAADDPSELTGADPADPPAADAAERGLRPVRGAAERVRRAASDPVEQGLRAGSDPAEQGLRAGSDPAERAREICLRQLAVRPRTHAELAATLRRQGIPEAIAAEVLDRYRDVGMIDDAAFARAWVTSRHHGRGLAGGALSRELRQRGVDPETVGEALAELDSDTELATARELVARKLRSTGGGDPAKLLRRLVGMLARKGYSPGLAFRVVKEALAADERTAELADQLDPDALADAAGPEGAT